MSTISVQSPNSSPWRSAGLWLCSFLIAYLFFNVIRAIINPIAFADSFGTPLSDPASYAFVFVYAIRTLFVALFGLVLLLRRNYASLALFILIATIMPIGDALLVAQQGANVAVIARHVIIAGIVLLTWFLLWRWMRQKESTASS